MELSAATCFSPNPLVLTARVGGEAVLLDSESEEYFGLNDVGTRVWDLATTGICLGAIRRRVAEEFLAPPDRIAADVDNLVQQLVRQRLLVLADSE